MRYCTVDLLPERGVDTQRRVRWGRGHSHSTDGRRHSSMAFPDRLWQMMALTDDDSVTTPPPAPRPRHLTPAQWQWEGGGSEEGVEESWQDWVLSKRDQAQSRSDWVCPEMESSHFLPSSEWGFDSCVKFNYREIKRITAFIFLHKFMTVTFMLPTKGPPSLDVKLVQWVLLLPFPLGQLDPGLLNRSIKKGSSGIETLNTVACVWECVVCVLVCACIQVSTIVSSVSCQLVFYIWINFISFYLTFPWCELSKSDGLFKDMNL